MPTLHREAPLRRPTPPRAVFTCLALVCIACLGEEAAQEPVIRPVLVHPAAPVSANQERTFPARARAGTESQLSFKVAGQLREILVAVGETVERGQRIAVLDDTDLRLELRKAQAGYAEARARDQNAQSEFARMKVLYERDAASANQLETAQTNAISTRASLEAQAQAVAMVEAQLGYAELLAPADGLIASVPVNVNENVGIGEPIATLNAGGSPEVAFNVPESLIGSIERGQPATVRFATLQDVVLPAEIIEVGVGSGRTAFPVTARLLESDDRIRSGMVAEATVRFQRGEQAGNSNLVVPSFSVVEDANGRFVYLAVGSEGGLATIERREVEIGPLSVEGLEIARGLEVGDRVVVAGLRFIEPGMTVRILEP